VVTGVFLGLGRTAIPAETPPTKVVSPPVSAPPSAPAVPLPNGILAWDAESKSVDTLVGDAQSHLVFNFTNVSPAQVVIVDASAGCHCTSLQVPPLPWTIAPGSNGQIGVTINLRGLATQPSTWFKNFTVMTDQGKKTLNVCLNVRALVLPPLSEADRARDLQIARTNRQAVLQGDCVICHVKPGEGRYGQTLYGADCGICHEGEHRAVQVPDLHGLKAATNGEFWRTWITRGKPGSLMPAFSTAEGGPLSDQQISTLVAWLTQALSPAPPPTPPTPPPVPPLPPVQK
jgi:mono/diheme cytochrome c family protein